MKIILFISLLISNIFASDFSANKLTNDDIKKLKEIKKEGKKFGLGYTLMAIAIKESELGKYLVNVDSRDFGLYQANIKTVIRRHNVKDTANNRNKFAMKLISDFKFATENAIDELTYWQKVHNNDWKKIWSSYNGGWKYNSQKAKSYSEEIENIIKELKKVDV